MRKNGTSDIQRISKLLTYFLNLGIEHKSLLYLSYFYVCKYTAAAAAKSLQSCLTLCDPIDGSPPGSSVPGILQAIRLEWAVISFSNASMHAKSFQSCPTPYDPMDSSPPGSSVHGILQASILEWVTSSFSLVNTQYLIK